MNGSFILSESDNFLAMFSTLRCGYTELTFLVLVSESDFLSDKIEFN